MASTRKICFIFMMVSLSLIFRGKPVSGSTSNVCYSTPSCSLYAHQSCLLVGKDSNNDSPYGTCDSACCFCGGLENELLCGGWCQSQTPTGKFYSHANCYETYCHCIYTTVPPPPICYATPACSPFASAWCGGKNQGVDLPSTKCSADCCFCGGFENEEWCQAYCQWVAPMGQTVGSVQCTQEDCWCTYANKKKLGVLSPSTPYVS